MVILPIICVFVNFIQIEVSILEILNRILTLLKENNKRQIDLTNHLGINKNAVTNWKIGDNASYKKYLPEIAEFFGVSVDYLAGKQDSTPEDNFTYALYNEITHDLSQDQIEQIKKFADFLRNG